jgi:hypothetical protein
MDIEILGQDKENGKHVPSSVTETEVLFFQVTDRITGNHFFFEVGIFLSDNWG